MEESLEQKLAEQKKTFAGQRIDFELKLEAQKAGIIDAGDAIRLCERAGLKVSENFETVEGAKEAVESLAKAKPYLFGDTQVKIPPPRIGKAAMRSGPPAQAPPIGSITPAERISLGLEKNKK